MNGDADVLVIYIECLLVRGVGIAQRQVHFRLVILSAKLCCAAALPAPAAAKQRFKEIGKIAFTKFLGKGLAATTETSCTAKALLLLVLPRLLILLGMLPVLAVLVVFFTLLRVTQ